MEATFKRTIIPNTLEYDEEYFSRETALFYRQVWQEIIKTTLKLFPPTLVTIERFIEHLDHVPPDSHEVGLCGKNVYNIMTSSVHEGGRWRLLSWHFDPVLHSNEAIVLMYGQLTIKPLPIPIRETTQELYCKAIITEIPKPLTFRIVDENMSISIAMPEIE